MVPIPVVVSLSLIQGVLILALLYWVAGGPRGWRALLEYRRWWRESRVDEERAARRAAEARAASLHEGLVNREHAKQHWHAMAQAAEARAASWEERHRVVSDQRDHAVERYAAAADRLLAQEMKVDELLGAPAQNALVVERRYLEEIEAQRGLMTPEFFRQEYEADFVDDLLLAFPDRQARPPERRVVLDLKTAEARPGLPTWVERAIKRAIDDGEGNPEVPSLKAAHLVLRSARERRCFSLVVVPRPSHGVEAARLLCDGLGEPCDVREYAAGTFQWRCALPNGSEIAVVTPEHASGPAVSGRLWLKAAHLFGELDGWAMAAVDASREADSKLLVDVDA